MSMDFAGSFINALQAGQQNAQQRRRQNALMSAGQMASSGNTRGAMNTLLAGGYTEDYNNFAQINDRQRQEKMREDATAAYRDTTGNEQAKLGKVAEVYAGAGDFEGSAQIQELIAGKSEREKAELARGFQFFASTAATLAGENLPPEQAKQRALQMIQQSPYASPQAIERISALPVEGFTPQSLAGYAQSYGMNAAEIMGERTRLGERAEDNRREDERFDKTYRLQVRQVQNAERAPRAPVQLRGPSAKQLERVQESAESSRGLRGLAQEFASYLDQQGTDPVTGAGINPMKYLDREVQAMDALASRMTGLMRPAGSGATSDFEQRLYARGAPSTTKTREANREILAGLEKLGAISDARQFFYELYAEKYGTTNGAEQDFQQSREFQELTREDDSKPPPRPPGVPEDAVFDPQRRVWTRG